MKQSIIKYTILLLTLLLHHLSTAAQEGNSITNSPGAKIIDQVHADRDVNIHNVQNIYVNSQAYKKMQERIEELQEFCPDSKGEKKFKYCSKLDSAQKELEAFKQGVISLAETFQKITINTERLQKAKNFFEAGEFDKARGILDTEALESDQQKLLQRKAVLEKKVQENNNALKNNADELLIKAKLTAINYEHPNRFGTTKALFEASLKSSRNAENVFVYARFLHKHNQINQAEPLYSEVLEIRRNLAKVNTLTYLPKVADVLNNLGNLQRDKNDYEKAEAAYLEALEIRKKFAKDNPQTYLPKVADVLNNLGNLQWDKNDYTKAENSYLKALKIRRTFAKVDSQTYLPHVATTLNNLGVLQSNKSDYEKAKKSFLETLEIRKNLAKINPQTYLPHVAQTLNNLGLLHSILDDYKKAEKSFLDALEIKKI